MKTLIFRTVAPYLTALMLLFSVFILLRGHNEPGGGFIGGLIAASAFAIYGIAFGVPATRRAMWFHPIAIAGTGLLIAALSGLTGLFSGTPLLTGVWTKSPIIGFDISNVIIFDIGVYLVVAGAVSSIALALESTEDNH
ncbi:Na+/H+ antiporter subunit B [Tianweitania sediminis]|uniref:Na+/H+ antiporter subunit B n=1 Tax=Tianweitania sediminis TaxID=1502156 RepID=A0A8J7R235_9HYPH|nr:Na+/H+ antiporter subunit B [Tianweitania sediminis]MBP0438871.1 Na+/H+ antiporter subunit B [Tianweitania sediminis]